MIGFVLMQSERGKFDLIFFTKKKFFGAFDEYSSESNDFWTRAGSSQQNCLLIF